MLSVNKIYCWLFVFALLIQIPSIHLLKFLDELLVVFMMCLVFLDVVVNKQFKKYNISIEWLPYTKGISTTDIKGKIYDTNNK